MATVLLTPRFILATGRETEMAFLQAVPLLREALQHDTGEMELEDVFEGVGNGTLQLWIGFLRNEVRVVAVTDLYRYARKLVMRVLVAAGDIRHFTQEVAAMLVWAAERGATELEAHCRPAVTRLLRRYGFVYLRDVVTLSTKGE